MSQVATGDSIVYGRNAPLLVGQIAVLTAAVGFTTVPQGATYVMVQCTGKAVRYSDDGVSPTASTGMSVMLGTTLIYNGDMKAIKFIETAATAVIDFAFYA